MTSQEELLVVTAEECGELVQACSKILRFGNNEEKTKALTEEAGDLLCMIILLDEKGLVNWDELEDRAEVKREKLKKYSNIL